VSRRPSLSAIGQIAGYGRFILDRTGFRAVLTILYLLLGSITEGISILLLIPLLALVGPQYQTLKIDLHIPLVSRLLASNVSLGLIPVLLIFVGLMIAQAVFARFKQLYMTRLLIDFIADIRIELFESFGRARWTKIARMRGSDLTHVLNADIDRMNGVGINYFLFVQNIVVLIVYFGVAFLISPGMTVFAGLMGVLVMAILQPIRKLASQHGVGLSERRREEYRIVSEFLTGLKVAKSFNSEPRYFNALAGVIRQSSVEQVAWSRVNSLSTLVFQVATVLGLAGFVYVALAQFSLPLPKMMAMILVFMRLAPRFTQVQNQVQEILVNLPAVSNVLAVKAECDAAAEDHIGEVQPRFPSLTEAIRFSHVGFTYSGEPVTKDVSLEIPAKRITALIGPSGGGKSTIADLLMGLLEPSEGSITIDGVPLTEANRRSWRDRVAYVPQDVFLLHDTIAANMLIAAPQATEEMIWKALEAANARDFVEAFPDGLQTIVADRGARLSGGERQRIALARGLLREPDLLILDEATSALDGETQAMIALSIERLRTTMTILTIAHRATMVAIADHVIVIEGGRVVEAGGFDELTRSGSGRLNSLIATEGPAG
jgi:ATP-binding cassette subfamily C protein